MEKDIEKDFDYSCPNFLRASTEDDKLYGIDFWLCDIPFAYRKRRIDFRGDITIRVGRISGSKTEFQKIMDGSFKAKFYLYDFLDRIIFCSMRDIKQALKNEKYEIKRNRDLTIAFAIISLDQITHIKFMKVKER